MVAFANFGREGHFEERANQRFFYLVVDGSGAGDVNQQDIQSFFRSGMNTGSDFVFVFIDIAVDDRLRQYLSAKKGGVSLYNEIQKKRPVFLISTKSLLNKTDVIDVELVAITNYDRDIDAIYKHMGLNSQTTRMVAIRFLKKVNQYTHLKPNFAGIGINLNEIVEDLLRRLENTAP
jgi:hypothetical protein